MSRSPKAKLRRKGLSKIGISAPPKRALLSRLVDYFWERGWLLWTHQDNDQHRWSLRVQGEHTETHTFETLIELWRWWARRVTWAFVAEASFEDALALYLNDDKELSLAIRHWAMTSGDSCLMRDRDIVAAYRSFFLHIQDDLAADIASRRLPGSQRQLLVLPTSYTDDSPRTTNGVRPACDDDLDHARRN